MLPNEHRHDDLRFQIVSWTEPGRRCILDGGDFGCIEVHPGGGVNYFAFVRIVDERLKVVRAFFDDEPQSFPFSFVSLLVDAHVRQDCSAFVSPATAVRIRCETRSTTMPLTDDAGIPIP